MPLKNGHFYLPVIPVEPVNRKYKGAETRFGNLKQEDYELLNQLSINRNMPKTIKANFPCLVDSRNMYYRTAWLNPYEYVKERKRWGNRCVILERRKK